MLKPIYNQARKGRDLNYHTWEVFKEQAMDVSYIHQGFSKCNMPQHDLEGKHTDFWAHSQRP